MNDYPSFILAGPIYQIAPGTPDHFLAWLATLPDDLLLRSKSMDGNLVAVYFRCGLGVALERANGYSVDINGYRWLIGDSWLGEVDRVEHEIANSAAQRGDPVVIGSVRQKLVARLGQVVLSCGVA